MSESLEELRRELDAIDARLLDVLRERAGVVERVRVAKQAAGEPTRDPTRERDVLARALARGRELGLSESLVATVMTAVLEASAAQQDVHGPRR